MPTFSVQVRDAGGKSRTEVHSGPSQGDVVAQLKRSGLTVLTIKHTETRGVTKSVKRPGEITLFQRKELKVASVAQFCRQLGTMIKAGMSLLDALETIRDESDDPLLQGILTEVAADVEGGLSLAEALRKHERAFTRIFVSMVEAGEASGSLEEVLSQMALFFRRRYELQKTIKSATAYPKFVGGFFTLMLIGIFGFLIPQFDAIFSKMGSELPPLTKVLVAGSDAIRDYWYITFPLLLALIVVFFLWKRTPGGRLKMDELILKAPLFGDFAKKANTSRLAMTLAILIRNGVTLDQSLEIAAKTMDNQIIERSILKVRNEVVEGASLHTALGNSQIFPSLMGKMVKVGEEAGSLPEMLSEVTLYFEDEVDSIVKKMSAMIEPAIMVLLGAVVLVVLLGVYLPIFNMSQTAAGG